MPVVSGGWQTLQIWPAASISQSSRQGETGKLERDALPSRAHLKVVTIARFFNVVGAIVWVVGVPYAGMSGVIPSFRSTSALLGNSTTTRGNSTLAPSSSAEWNESIALSMSSHRASNGCSGVCVNAIRARGSGVRSNSFNRSPSSYWLRLPRPVWRPVNLAARGIGPAPDARSTR